MLQLSHCLWLWLIVLYRLPFIEFLLSLFFFAPLVSILFLAESSHQQQQQVLLTIQQQRKAFELRKIYFPSTFDGEITHRCVQCSTKEQENRLWVIRHHNDRNSLPWINLYWFATNDDDDDDMTMWKNVGICSLSYADERELPFSDLQIVYIFSIMLIPLWNPFFLLWLFVIVNFFRFLCVNTINKFPMQKIHN